LLVNFLEGVGKLSQDLLFLLAAFDG